MTSCSKETASDKNQNMNDYYVYNSLGIDVLVEYHLDAKANGNPVPGGEKGDLNEYYYGNGRLLAMKEIDNPGNGKRDPMKDLSFYHQDALGSVMMLTGKNGQVVAKYQYDAFGEVYDGKFGENSNPDNPFGFTEKRYEPEVGVYSFAFRDYNPRTMRWMTEDPVGDGGNWYRYCYGDPVNLVDPLGLEYVPINEKIAAVLVLGPIDALEAGQIGKERIEAANQYAKDNGLGVPLNNEADAYRHLTWNVENTEKFGTDKAEKIADNHEIYGEDGFGGSRDSQMDLWNNSLGRQLGNQFKEDSCDEIWDLAKTMNLPVMSPDDTRLDNWDFNKDAPIPKLENNVLDYAKRNELDADITEIVYEARYVNPYFDKLISTCHNN